MRLEGTLKKINKPQDLKALSFNELNKLATEIRNLIISTVSHTGGHLASNLGVVELTLALHRELDSPKDMIIWDVGHQCYTHKIITGRYENFPTLRTQGGIAGFPKFSESSHDWFNTGHASTSISAALGLLAAQNILEKSKKSSSGAIAAAVIGDGALTGGLAFEALSHAGQLGLPLIVVLNDNKMSISPNVGGLSKYLSRLSMKAKYQLFRRTFDAMVKRIPYLGDLFFDVVVRLKRAVKAVFYSDNFFVDLGFEYVGPIEGHNIRLLSSVIRDAKNLAKPVVIHVITQKGKGYSLAEDEPEAYHGVSSNTITESLCFTEVFGNAIHRAAKEDKRIAAITAAMEKGTGLSSFKQDFPERFFDVGIAEEHAITFAAGLARKGLRPVAAIYSTFIQRAIDQIIHDVCLQNLPVIIALDRAGFVSDDGETHQGIYDISLFRAAPNMIIFAPAGARELEAMLTWAFQHNGPIMIRYPKNNVPLDDPVFSLDIEKGKGIFIHSKTGEQSEACIIFTGSLFHEVKEAQVFLDKKGIPADLYNLRFIKPIDEDYLVNVLNSYANIIIAEEGIIAGGIGEYISELALRKGCFCKIKICGVSHKKDFLGTRSQLLFKHGLDAESIAVAVMDMTVMAPLPMGVLAKA